MAEELDEKIKSYIKQRPEWFETLILGAAIKDPEFFMRVRSILCKTIDGKDVEDDFNELLRNSVYLAVADYNTARLVNTAKDFIPINFKVLRSLLKSRVANAEDIEEDEIPKALLLFNEALEVDIERWRPFIEAGIVPWLEHQKMMRVVRSPYIFGGWSLADIREKLQAVADKAGALDSTIKIVRKDFGHFLDHPEADGMLNEVLESNLAALNETTAGGFGKGETVLIISPSSGGKTILACQLAGHWAMEGKGGLFVTTEQPQPELEVRIVSNFANIPFKYLARQWKPDELSMKYQDSYKKMRAEMKAPIHMIDWTRPGQTLVNDLRHEVELYHDDFGELPEYLIFDWIGGALQQEAGGDSQKLRALYKEAVEQVKNIAHEYNLAGIALAQATPGTSLNRFPLDHRHIADAKNMIEGVTSLIGLTALYADNMDEVTDRSKVMYHEKQYICVSKSRKGPGGNAPVKRNYEYQRLENYYGGS